jgi:hypothetical protein
VMRRLYILLKIIISLAAVCSMFFAAHFWIGTKEEWDNQIIYHFYEFVFARFSFTLADGFLCFCLSMFLNWVFRFRIYNVMKYPLYEFLAVVGIACVFVLTTIYA